eukprot:2356618-Alexandrium_andersonii.AAC.1
MISPSNCAACCIFGNWESVVATWEKGSSGMVSFGHKSPSHDKACCGAQPYMAKHLGKVSGSTSAC